MNNISNTISQHRYQNISGISETEAPPSEIDHPIFSLDDELMLEMHASHPPMPPFVFGTFAFDDIPFPHMPTPPPPVQEPIRGQLLDDGELHHLNGILDSIGRNENIDGFISSKLDYWPSEDEPYPPPPSSRLSNQITHQIQNFLENTSSPLTTPQHVLPELQQDLHMIRSGNLNSSMHTGHTTGFGQSFNGQPGTQVTSEYSHSLTGQNTPQGLGGFSQSLKAQVTTQALNAFNQALSNHALPQEIIVNPFDGSHGMLPTGSNNIYSTAAETQVLNTLAWGSDTNFAHSGYTAPAPAINSEQDLQRKVLTMVGAQNSSTTTRANSPTEIKFESIGEDMPTNEGPAYTSYKVVSPTSSTPQFNGLKRRAEEEDSYEQQSTRRSRTRKDSSEPAATPAPRRRGGKRDQLTEAEKRANHIMSEQKRRNQIKHGFDKLTEIVPELRSGGYSKSAVLTHTALFVENLVGGNERLRKIVQDLEQQRGLSVSHAPSGYGPLQ